MRPHSPLRQSLDPNSRFFPQNPFSQGAHLPSSRQSRWLTCLETQRPPQIGGTYSVRTE